VIVRDTKGFKTYMALLITVAVISVLLILCYNPVPVTSNDAVMLVLGGLLARMGDIYGYYFGSSEGSQRKTELLKGTRDDTSAPT
jgi:predicted CDP-diglyceride synthetase/phosphatidate cytidylyltransferase